MVGGHDPPRTPLEETILQGGWAVMIVVIVVIMVVVGIVSMCHD
jgi:hypothetical protein